MPQQYYFEGKELTYSALNERADELAQHIHIHSPNSSFVGVSTTRSIEMIIGVLAILKAGKAYLPLDPAYPADRLQQMISDSGIQLCLASKPEFPLFQALETGIHLMATESENGTVEKQVFLYAGIARLCTVYFRFNRKTKRRVYGPSCTGESAHLAAEKF